MASSRLPLSDTGSTRLLAELEPAFGAILRRHAVPAQDGEDLVQRALLAWVAKRDTVRHPERWLPVALRNECLAYWRRRRRRFYTAVDESILELLDDPSQPRQEQEDVRRDLSAAIEGIPGRCRSALALRYGLGLEPAETAAQMGYRPSGIYKILERCLAALSGTLTGYSPSHTDGRDAHGGLL